MRKAIIVATIGAVIGAIGAPLYRSDTAHASTHCAATVSCVATTNECERGDTVSVDVWLESECDVAAATWTVSYDSSVLRCESMEPGQYFNGYQTMTVPVMLDEAIDNERGLVGDTGIIIVGQPEKAPAGADVLARYRFTAIAEGDTTIEVLGAEIATDGGPMLSGPGLAVESTVVTVGGGGASEDSQQGPQDVAQGESGNLLSVPACQSVASVGDTFDVDVFIQCEDESSGTQCTLTYDPDVVHCQGVDFGSFYSDNKPDGVTVLPLPPGDIDNDAGNTSLFGMGCMPTISGATGSGVFAVLHFEAVGTGTSTLAFSEAAIAGTGAQPQPLDATFIDGELRVGESCSNPDLTITDMDCSWVTQGSTYKVDFTLRNAGGSVSPECSVAVKIAGTVEENVTCPSLNELETYRSTSGPFTLPTDSDTVTVQVCADGPGEIAESNEGNNCQSTSWPGLPEPPSGLTASCDSSGKVDLKWKDNSDNEDGFVVQRSTSIYFPEDDDKTIECKADKNAKAYTDDETPAGTTLHYRVLAYNANGRSAPSDYVTIKSPTALERLVPPVQPTNLHLRDLDGRTIYLEWNDNATNETEYRIERSTSEDFGENQRRFTVGKDDRRYTDNATELGKTYYYRVFARNQKGDSVESNVISVTLLQPPAGVEVEITADAQVNLSWTDNSGNEDGFTIERANDPNFLTPVAAYTVGADVTRFGDIDVLPDETYYYRVLAHSGGFVSASSNVVTASPRATLERRIAPSVSLERAIDPRGMFVEDFTCTRLEGVRQMCITAGTLIRDRTGYLALELESTPLDYPVLAPSEATLIDIPQHYHPFGMRSLPAVTVVSERECQVVNSMIKLGPDGTRFSQPVAMTLTYDSSRVPLGVEPEQLRMAYYDPGTDSWILLPSVSSPSDQMVTAWVSHFSVFAVVAPGDVTFPWGQMAVIWLIEVFAGALVVLNARTRRQPVVRQGPAYVPVPLALPPGREMHPHGGSN